MGFKIGQRIKVVKHILTCPVPLGSVAMVTVDHEKLAITGYGAEQWAFLAEEVELLDDAHLTHGGLRQDAANQGVKGDAGKPDLSLLSPIWIFGVGEVLTYGAKKRGQHNWRKGLAITRLCAGAIRHIFQFLSGEDLDRDDKCSGCINYDKTQEPCANHSNKHHLHCASCNLMFASELIVTRPDLDDRYKIQLPKGE